MTEPSTQVRQELRALPEIPLPDALWQRVEAVRLRKVQRRKTGIGIVTLALVAVMASPLLVPLFTGTGRVQGEQLVAHPLADGARDIQADVRALDQALQAAYDRGASDAEIAPMWVARNALVGSSLSRSAIPAPNQI